MINQLISKIAQRNFIKAMQFEEGKLPQIPSAESKKNRLLYIHIPFCEKLCPYCSFNRLLLDKNLAHDYFQALRKEIVLYKEKGYEFQGLYVGGGTPTILIEELEETIALARQCFSIQAISVETKPDHLTESKMAALERVGVKRFSVGVQSFNNDLLKAMGRYDKCGSGEAIAERLRELRGRFDTLNVDMIFNFPQQTMEMLQRDIDILTDLNIDQITYYPLMVSSSVKEKMNRSFGKFNYRQEGQFYHPIVEQLTKSYNFSSAWCFSRKKAMVDEYIVEYEEYAGLGSGSIGFLDGTCYANTFDLREYIERIHRGELPLIAARNYNIQDQIRYDFLMKLFGMRLNIPTLQQKYNGKAYSHLWLGLLAFMLVGGLRYKRSDFFLTKKGRYQWVLMMREFFISVNNFREDCRSRITT
ncbi:MAG: coproporphyrinogen III oxidase family protein [Oligoflexia bacterium]|nr:coproporphyrinogen III oxidase family protein [Oligoflexia bacterium]